MNAGGKDQDIPVHPFSKIFYNIFVKDAGSAIDPILVGENIKRSFRESWLMLQVFGIKGLQDTGHAGYNRRKKPGSVLKRVVVEIMDCNTPGFHMVIRNSCGHDAVFIFLYVQIKDNGKIHPGNMRHCF